MKWKIILACAVLCFSVGVQLFLPQVFQAWTPEEELEVGELRFWLLALAIGAAIALLVMAFRAIRARIAVQ